MRDEMVWMFVGIFMTLSVIGVIINRSTALMDDFKLIIHECEKELPRNQTCILTAIPSGEVNE